MLRIFGSPKTLCDGITRRDFLQVGGLGTLGLTLGDALRAKSAAAPLEAGSFGKAKSCILLFLFGSPAQHETFDPKPDAPLEIQGQHKAIRTNVPGLFIGEGLPKTARIMDRVTLVRSMNHAYPVHGVAYAITGIEGYSVDLEQNPRDARHWPFIGSVVDYLEQRRGGGAMPKLPRNIGLPWLLGSKTDLAPYSGPYGAFLGNAYNPVWTDFQGRGTRIAPRNYERQRHVYHDPFVGIEPNGRFHLAGGGDLPRDLSMDRLGVRRSLLAQFDQQRQAFDKAGQAYGHFREMAFSLLTSSRIREALDIGREPMALREAYGMTLFGQGCLAARRLVEAGGKFVSVYWDLFGEFSNGAWDTHQYHYERLKVLLPGFDAAFSALITDLEARGMLDETLVLVMSEHGRTPKIDSTRPGAGRQHWSRVYSTALAGGGTAQGKVVGSSDRLGGDVADTPFSPKDILATTYHLLGIDPHTTIPDSLGRPLPIAGHQGRVREEVFG